MNTEEYIAALKADFADVETQGMAAHQEIKRLLNVNIELVAALEAAIENHPSPSVCKQGMRALERARGEA